MVGATHSIQERKWEGWHLPMGFTTLGRRGESQHFLEAEANIVQARLAQFEIDSESHGYLLDCVVFTSGDIFRSRVCLVSKPIHPHPGTVAPAVKPHEHARKPANSLRQPSSRSRRTLSRPRVERPQICWQYFGSGNAGGRRGGGGGGQQHRRRHAGKIKVSV